MNIRKAILTDAEAIAKQNILLAKESEEMLLDFETVYKGVKSLLCDQNKGFYIVAEEDNTIIGQLMVTFEWSDWKNTMIWWIQSVYVQKHWRNKGVFTKLFNYIKQQAQKNHVSIIRLYVHKNNSSAQTVYHKMNMKNQPYIVYQLQTKN